MSSYASFNCSSPPPIQANSDIAGIGVSIPNLASPQHRLTHWDFKVVVSFVATAYFTLILVLIHFLLDCSPADDQNAIDKGVVRFLRKILRLRPTEVWGPAILRGVLVFSDQQLVTGIAMLGAGYSQLSYGLPVYYWQIVVQLTWFSSVTHLATMSLLQQYFWKYSAARWWRIGLMIVLAAMQILALVPSGFADWGTTISGDEVTLSYSIPVACYYSQSDYRPGGRIYNQIRESYAGFSLSLNWGSFSMTMAYLIISYTTRLVKLSQSTTLFLRSWLRVKPGNWYKQLLVRLHRRATRADSVQGRVACIIVHKGALTIFTLLRATFDLTGSILWEYADTLLPFSLPSPLSYNHRTITDP